MQITRQQLDTVLPQVARPARYTGGEWNAIIKDWEHIPLRLALSYPDLYEIGASNLAIPILYEIINAQPDALAERVYTPWPDMAAALRSSGTPLYSLESKHPLVDFDILGFSLEYELTYTNVLETLALAGIPVFTSERTDAHPLVIAGGTCCLNPEPMADFIDLFVIGEGEDAIVELLELLRQWKGKDTGTPADSRTQKKNRRYDFLLRAAKLDGIYVPSFYKIDYSSNSTVQAIVPAVPEALPLIKRRILNKLPLPVTRPIVPYIEVVQDRAAIEIQRGCTRGCRFCQAGVVYRPVRERPVDEIVRAVGELLRNTGYRELSLVSLSTSDYHAIEQLVRELVENYQKEKIALSLPSLRIDNFSVKLMEALPQQKKLALTFAPEAGSERLRCAINKAVKEEQILETAQAAFNQGWNAIKLYFMLGLPTEQEEDLESIGGLVQKITALRGKGGRRPQIKASLSSFVPKPHTPFQWTGQNSLEELLRKQAVVKRSLRKTGAQISWNSPHASLLEATLSRGDRRMSGVIHKAWQSGCIFNAWSERLDFDKWLEAFKSCGLSPEFYAQRERDRNECLPWEHIETGISSEHLRREYERTLKGLETPDCRSGRCHACGLQEWLPDCSQQLKATASR